MLTRLCFMSFGARALALSCLIGAFLALSPTDAQAQYRNNSWGFYAGPMVLLPSNNVNYFRQSAAIAAAQQAGTVLPQRTAGTPYSTFNPIVAGEYAFKISLDHWWYKIGLNVGILSLVTDPAFGSVGGTVIMAEFITGPRVYFVTDNIRPYLEMGIRVPGMIYTTSTGDAVDTNLKVWPGIYGALGLEIILVRDVALSIVGRYTLNLPFNFPVFHTAEGLLGIVLYM